MNPLIIEPREDSPAIKFDPDRHYFEISGESRPENTARFYAPVFEWLGEYFNYRYWWDDQYGADKAAITMVFKMDYFNSTSAKYFLDLIVKLAESKNKATPLVIKWHCDEEDIDMKEAGEQMSAMTEVPFEIIEGF